MSDKKEVTKKKTSPVQKSAPKKAAVKKPAAKRTRKAPVKKAPVKKAPVKSKSKSSRMSIAQKLASSSKNTRLTGAFEQISVALRKSASEKENKKILNQMGSIRDGLMKGKPSSKDVDSVIAMIRKDGQKVWKAAVAESATAELKKVFEKGRELFKGQSQAKSLPELF